MKVKPRQIVFLELENGKSPFEQWFSSIKDSKFKQAIVARITRVRNGNFGDHKSVGDGVFELRIFKGSGFRVYYGLDGDELVVILGGGDKRTQAKDIQAAKELWRKYKNEN